MKNILKIFAISLVLIGSLFFSENVFADQLITVSVTATPNLILPGGSSVINWASNGADVCTFGTTPVGTSTPSPSIGMKTTPIKKILGFFVDKSEAAAEIPTDGGDVGTGGTGGTVDVSGSTTVSPTMTRSYTVTCSNANPALTKSASVTVTVSTSLPDLVIGGIESSTITGGSGTFSIKIANTGSLSTMSGFSNLVEIKKVLDNGGYSEESVSSSSVGAGVVAPNQSVTVSSPFSISAGSYNPDNVYYSARFCADSSGSINEFNENNNCTSWSCPWSVSSILATGKFILSYECGCGGGTTGDYPGETCSDGIQNQNETGVDIGGVCSVVNSPTGDIYASNCTIYLGDRTCNSDLEWNTLNPKNGVISTVGTSYVEVATGNSGTKSHPIGGGDTTFFLFHDGAVLDQAIATASCVAGTKLDRTGCITDPDTNEVLGSLSATNCTISVGGKSCNTNLSWNTVNPVPGLSSAVTTPVDITVATGNAGTKSYLINYGSTNFFLYHNEKELVKRTAIASCATGSEWDGIICKSSDVIPTGTLDGLDCVIEKNASTCTTTLTLSISNPLVGANTNITKPVNVQVASGITPVDKPGIVVHYPNTTFYLNHGESTLAEKLINASCVSETAWNGTICAEASTLPYGTISASDCVVLSGESSCETSIVWDTLNPIIGVSSVIKEIPSTIVSNGNSGTKLYPISPTGAVFTLSHNGKELAQDSAIATCANGTIWNGTSCSVNPLPTGTLEGADCTIPENGSVCNTTLTLGITNPIPLANTNITKVGGAVVANGITPIEKPGIEVSYPGTKFFLNHNSLSLAEKMIYANCTSSTGWNSSLGKCILGFVEPTCHDGIQNQNETGVDVGGVCGSGSDDGTGTGTEDDSCTYGNWSSCNALADCSESGIQTRDRSCTLTGAGTDTAICFATGCKVDGDKDGNQWNVTLTATPAKIFKGRASLLTWDSNASRCDAMPGYGEFNTGGKAKSDINNPVYVTPSVTTNYGIVCTKNGVTDTDYATITVNGIKIKER